MKFLLGLLLFLPIFGWAKVYECTIEGETSFQSKPCSAKTVGEMKPSLIRSEKAVSDLFQVNLENYQRNFSECKSHILGMQASALKQNFNFLILENTTTDYKVKVCMSEHRALMLSCDGMHRRMTLRRTAACE